MGVILVMVKPFDEALEIVKAIALPMVAVNALGFVLMIIIMTYVSKQKELFVEQSRLESELEVATVIQQSLLPNLNEDFPGCKEVDVSASMDPAKEVGGDFYDVFYVDKTHLAFAIGDVSGKGIPAALFMASAKSILQNCIRDIGTLSNAIIAANKSLCTQNDAGMFVTLWVGVFDIMNGTLNYVNAGHNPPVLLHNNKGEFLTTKPDFVLGGFEDRIYKEHTTQLEDGDLFFLYTDGVTEAEDKEHNLFGNERLLKCFEKVNDKNASQMIELVKENIDTFIAGNDQFDDMTILCFKWKKPN